MKSFQMNLLKKYQRPVISIAGINALIDTGAIIPVFYYSEEVVKKAFNGIKLNQETTSFGGFGDECFGNIYRLPDFSIGNLVYQEIDVFIPQDSSFINYPLILPATLFYGMRYTIDTIAGKFIVEYDESKILSFHIENLMGTLYAQINGVLSQEHNIVPSYMAVGYIGK